MATEAVIFAERAGSTVSVQVDAQNEDEAIHQAMLSALHADTALWLATVLEVRAMAP